MFHEIHSLDINERLIQPTFIVVNIAHAYNYSSKTM